MGKHKTSDPVVSEETVALILWQNAETVPAKILVMKEIFGMVEEEGDDDMDLQMSRSFGAIFEAAAGEYAEPVSNFDRAVTLQVGAPVSPTAKAVWEAVKGMGEYMEKQAEEEAAALAKEFDGEAERQDESSQ